MPHINIDIFARLHQRSLRNTEKEAQKRFQELGQKAADDLTKGVEKAAPKIRRAMHSAADAAGDYAKKTKDLTKIQKDQAAAAEKIAKMERTIGEQYDRNAQLAQEAAREESALGDVRKKQQTQTRAIATREANLRQKREENAKTAAKLRMEELKLKQIRLDYGLGSKKAKDYDKSLMDLRRQNAREAAYIRAKELELGQARVELKKRTEDVAATEGRLSDVRKEHSGSVKDLDSTEQELLRTRQEHTKTGADLIRLNEEATKSNRKREESLRRLAEAEDDHEKRSKRGGGNGKGGSGAGTIGNMLTDLPFVPSGRAGAVIGSGVLVGLASAAQAAVTASQAIAVLPAVLAAAGAGFATLAIGTHGFSDAIKDMGDPEKFATALQALSPAAQQAALEIQYLVQGPLGDLKNATQDTLFKGVAEQIHNLTNEFAPEITGLTTGVAGSFNNMFGNAVGQLMTPETSTSINNIINNIVAGFQHLEPAVAPVVSAIAKLTDTGSSFLPGFADAITNAANSFNNFITTAQQNGSLQGFIQKGIDAAVTLGHMIWDLGKKIYEVFGNKDPAEFKQTLDDMVASAMGVVQGIVAISHVVNDLLVAIQPIASAMGGWESLVQKAGAAFLLWKTKDVLIGLAGIGGAIDGLPGKAGGAAGAINKAFAAIVVPAALYEIADILTQIQHQKWEEEARNRREIDARAQDLGLKPQQPGVGDFGGPPAVGQTGPATPKPPALQNQLRDRIAKGQMPGFSIGPDGSIIDDKGNKVTLPGELTAPRTQGPPMPNGSVYAPPAPPPPPPPSPTAGLPGYSPLDVPQPTPKDADGSKITETERRDRIRAGLDPNSFLPDMGAMPALGGGPTAAPNFGSQPGAPGSPSFGTPPGGGTPPLQFGTNGDPYQKPGYGYNNVDPRDVADADYKRTQEARDLRDAKMDLAVLEKDDLATQEELLHAQEKVWDEQHQFDNAQLDYQEALQGKWKKVSSNMSQGMDQIGAHLDRDLGLSKGLSGLADNLVRFLGNLATAPIQQMLQNVINAHPNEGSGVVGIMAAQGAFGPQFTPQGIAAGQGGSSGSGGGSFLSNGANGLVQGVGGGNVGMPANLKDTGSVASGPQSRYAATVIGQLFGSQIRGPIGGSRDNNTAKGTHDAGLSIDIPIAEDQRGPGGLGDQVNQFLQANAAQLGLKYSIWRNKGAYPGGGGFNQPGHQDHIDAHFNGQPGSGGMPGGGLPGAVGGASPVGSAPMFSGFGQPGSKEATANMIYQQAMSRGYSPHEGQAIVAYAIGESSLNPGISGGPQGGSGAADEVVGLFQQKPAFARGGGIDPSQRSDPAYNTWAYLNQLEKHRNLPIEQALPATSSGGPLASGPGAQPQAWSPLMNQAAGLLGGATGGPAATWSPGIPAQGGGTAGGPGPSMPTGTSLGSNPALAGGPGLGAQPGYQPTQQPQAQQGWQAGAKGGGGGGGILGAAAGAAAGMFPGGGAAAQIAMQMIQRTIQYGGEVAGSLAKGAMDFFSVSDPDGGAGASIGDSWLGRLAGSVASGAPALPSSAGKSDQNAQQLAQQQGAQGQQGQQGQGNGPLIGTMNVQADKATGQQMANQMQYASAAAGLIPVG